MYCTTVHILFQKRNVFPKPHACAHVRSESLLNQQNRGVDRDWKVHEKGKERRDWQHSESQTGPYEQRRHLLSDLDIRVKAASVKLLAMLGRKSSKASAAMY